MTYLYCHIKNEERKSIKKALSKKKLENKVKSDNKKQK